MCGRKIPQPCGGYPFGTAVTKNDSDKNDIAVTMTNANDNINHDDILRLYN